MYVVIDAVGILVFISLAWLFSSDRHRIHWRPVALMVMTSLIIAWLLTSFTAGRAAVRAAAQGFRWLVDTAFQFLPVGVSHGHTRSSSSCRCSTFSATSVSCRGSSSGSDAD